LASRVPGFRKDDYPRAILRKLKWALEYAREHRLLPVLLGDLFHWPRDNSNWLLVELFELFQNEIIGISGNHDSKENELGPDDTLSVLSAADSFRLLDLSGPWLGSMNGRKVWVGGTSWGQSIPNRFECPDSELEGQRALVFWITHHDVRFAGYDDIGRFSPYEIPGVDIVVNGHIHRTLADTVVGMTTWVNPGNIARVRRTDADRERRPALLRIDVTVDGWEKQLVEIPCDPFDLVFHDEVVSAAIDRDESLFVRGLAELEQLKTQSGATLHAFLDQNLSQFDTRVADVIRALAKEVTTDVPN
jgi:predicted phosphodiesterase